MFSRFHRSAEARRKPAAYPVWSQHHVEERPLWRLLAAACLLCTLATAQLPFITINEINCDTPGTDMLEFIEIYTIPSQSLVGYTVVWFNGSTGVDRAYFAMDLTGTSDVNGFYLMGNTGVTPVPSQTWANNILQNGQDGIGLYWNAPAASWTTAGAGATPVATPPVGAVLTDALVYGTDDPAAAVLLANLLPGSPQINEGANGTQTAGDLSIGRCLDGTPNALDVSTFQQMPPTPGTFNTCVPAFRISITQTCPGPITISVVGAQPFHDLYNLIALTCSSPTGSGPLFGINADLAAGSPLTAFTYPAGTDPFHVVADAAGAYTLVVPTSGLCPSTFQISVEAVCVEALGLGFTRVTSQTTGCVLLNF